MAKWKQSWKEWFQSSKAKDVKTILENGRRQCTDPTLLTRPVATELRRITQRGSPQTPQKTGHDLSADLQGRTLQQLREYLSIDLATLTKEESSWQEKRYAGWKKITTGMTQLVQDFGTFLSRFSGIVEIINMADSQYGGAATLVLSVFFATIKLKAVNDNSIQSCMRTIANRLPDLEIYCQIFADDILATMMANAYAEIFIFAWSAILYFQDHGFGRMIRGLANPQGFQDHENALLKTFIEIRIRCDALVAQRIVQLSHNNDILRRKMDKLSKRLEEAESRRDDETRRAIFNRKYSEPRHLRQEKLAKLRKLLDSDLFHTYSDNKLVLTLHELKQQPKYKTWSEKSSSSMLIPHGNNNFEYSLVPKSWLSLSPLDLVAELQALGPSKTAVAYFNCDAERDAQPQPQSSGNSDSEQTTVIKPHHVLYSLADQLLEQQAKIMRNMSDVDDIAHRLKRIHFDQEDHHGAEHDSTAAIKAMIDDGCQNIRQILHRCQAQTVYIVIDSPEVCKGCETWYFVRSLLRLVEEDGDAPTGAVLKVLVVAKTLRWNIEDWVKVVDDRTLQDGKLLILRRDQGECDQIEVLSPRLRPDLLPRGWIQEELG